MRKVLLLLPVLGILLSTCSNEFDIAAPWKSIPVVYAIISPKDSAHYVRIEKAFLDPDNSALAVAQLVDSLYYGPNEIAVYLQKVGTTQRYPLERVDGVTEGFVRDSGVFATSPNWLYKIKPGTFPGLETSQTYRLIIERMDGSVPVTAETTLPKDFNFITPNPADIPPRMTFSNSQTTTVEWRTDVNGVYFRVVLRVRYREEDANGTLLKRDTLEWLAVPNTRRDQTPLGGNLYRGKVELAGSQFFRLLADNIEPSSTKFRYFEGIEIQLDGGGAEIEDYLVTAQANAGITGAEVLPTFTNIEPAGEGLGLFTGKNVSKISNIRVETKTVDSMNVLTLTKPLNFRY